MKTKLTVLFMSLFFIIGGVVNLNAQVNVGVGDPAEKYATLQIKDKTKVSSEPLDAATSEKGGLLLPRVELQKKKELLPFVTQAVVDANGQEYQDEKKLHTGLIIYNLVENDEEELCLGLNQWDGEQWNCFQSKMGNAIAELGNCDSLTFKGEYLDKVSLNSGNYMTIPLHVTKAGAYTITATTDPDNGYYFTASGVFLTPGYYFISVPGAGTPLTFTPDGNDGDLIKVTFNNKLLDACDPLNIKVADSSIKPMYSMACGSAKVHGVYKFNQEVNAGGTQEHYIDLTLNVDVEAVGAHYVIETDVVDGLSFRGEGKLNSTPIQTVRLMGSGTPTTYDDKIFTLTTNSKKTGATCSVTVFIVIPTKKVLTIGTGSTYGYNLANNRPSGIMMREPRNYGVLEESVVKYEGWSIIDGGNGPSATNLQNYLLGSDPVDMVIIGYSWGPSDAEADILVEYLRKKGVILMYCEESGGNQRVSRRIFNDPSISQSTTGGTGDGRTYSLPLIDDPILNGPFGDIRGEKWGDDATDVVYMSNIPYSDIIIYSNATNANNNTGSVVGAITAYRHKVFNLIWVGEGGFNSQAGNSGELTSSTICPFMIDSNNKPIPKTTYGPTGTRIYNSTFTANALCWAIRQAQFNGINTPN